MRFLFGRYQHAVDGKGRISIPQKFRDVFVMGASRRITVLEGFEGCLFAYPTPHFERILEHLMSQEFDRAKIRELLRRLSARGSEVDMDAQGRIQLSDEQRRAASLDRDALVIGVGRRIEIWSPEVFDTRPNQSDVSELAEGVLHDIAWSGDAAPEAAQPGLESGRLH